MSNDQTTTDKGEWESHVPGDPRPCDADTVIKIRLGSGMESRPLKASDVYWGKGLGDSEIVAWRSVPLRALTPAPDSDSTIRADDPKGAAGALKAPMWLLPPHAMQQTAWVQKLGAEKYGPFNWREKAVCASTYISAIMRHLDAWRDGEDLDPESGLTHLAHIAANCNILMDAHRCDKLIDDRSKMP